MRRRHSGFSPEDGRVGLPIKEKFAKEGKLLDDGDCCPIHPFEDGYTFHMETPCRHDPCDRESIKAAIELGEVSIKAGVEKNLAIGMFDGLDSLHDQVHDIAGPRCLNYHLWMKKIKKAFDPNLVSESSSYTTPKE